MVFVTSKSFFIALIISHLPTPPVSSAFLRFLRYLLFQLLSFIVRMSMAELVVPRPEIGFVVGLVLAVA